MASGTWRLISKYCSSIGVSFMGRGMEVETILSCLWISLVIPRCPEDPTKTVVSRGDAEIAERQPPRLRVKHQLHRSPDSKESSILRCELDDDGLTKRGVRQPVCEDDPSLLRCALSRA